MDENELVTGTGKKGLLGETPSAIRLGMFVRQKRGCFSLKRNEG